MELGAEVGMLVVETVAKIRHAYFVQGKPIKAICRELNLSRKVVRKVIRSEATEFRYEREAQPLPKIGPWKDDLERLLLANQGKAARERLTLIRVFEELRDRGYEGGYDAVHRGDPAKFFHGELESQCASCHSGAKQREEAEGVRREIDSDGWPVDARHPFNRGSPST